MAREFPLWVIVALPGLAGLIALLFARQQVGILGPRRAVGFVHYLALGASVLALLFAAQAIQHLLAPDDPRALAHTPLRELLEPIVVGSVRIEATLVADRLSSCTVLLLAGAFTLARLFFAGPAGLRDLGLLGPHEPDPGVAATAIRRLGWIGLLEAAASLFALAGDLGLAAVGWALLGLGATVAVAREIDDEQRASAATKVLVMSLVGDLALGAAAVMLVVSGIGLAHNEMWAPLTGDRLYAIGLFGLPTAELLALLLLGAVVLRSASLAWTGNSLAEAVLDAIVVPIAGVYLLVRYQRVLGYAPSVLAGALVVGMLLALLASAIALARPARGLALRGPRPGGETGLAWTGLAWTGLLLLAIGVGAWRTAVLLVIAQALGRLGLRLALLVADDDQLPAWTAAIGRVLGWAVAGVAPSLGFVAIAQTLLDVLSRTSLLAPWISWVAAGSVLVVAFAHAAGIARIWYEHLGRKPGSASTADEDGLDFAPLLLAWLGLTGLGVVSLAAWFGLAPSFLAWLDLLLPLGGGHEAAPLGLRPGFRDGVEVGVARRFVAGSGVLVALITGLGWMWARERFRRAHGGELASLAATLERAFAVPRRIGAAVGLALVGLTELAAAGLGRGLFEQGPEVVKHLVRDATATVEPPARRLGLDGARQAQLGIVLGLALLLGWLYAKPDISTLLPADGYGFGGLRPKLIRAGGKTTTAGEPTAPDVAEPPGPDTAESDSFSTPVDPTPLAPRRDAAEPAPLGADLEVGR